MSVYQLIMHANYLQAFSILKVHLSEMGGLPHDCKRNKFCYCSSYINYLLAIIAYGRMYMLLFRKIEITEYFKLPSLTFDSIIMILQHMLHTKQNKAAETLAKQYILCSSDDPSKFNYITPEQRSKLLSLIKIERNEQPTEIAYSMTPILVIFTAIICGVIFRRPMLIVGRMIKRKLVALMKIIFAL